MASAELGYDEFVDAIGEFADAQTTLVQHGKTFRFAQRMLARRTATDAAKLYQFCRICDDLVDEAPDTDTAIARLTQLKSSLSQSNCGLPSIQSFQQLKADYGICDIAITGLLDGMASDLTETTKADENELLQYCFRVAGTVGLMMCPILQAPRTAEAFAIDLGVAMQLTNISRDILEDAHKGRIYLPQTWLGGLSPKHIIYPSPTQKLVIQQAQQRCLTLAEKYYCSAEIGLKAIPSRNRYAMFCALHLYREIGVEIARQNYAFDDGRVVISNRHKLGVLLKRAFYNPLNSYGDVHQAELHNSFRHLYQSDA